MKLPDPILRSRDSELSDWIDYCNLVINTGKYEFPIYSEEPGSTKANEGESLIVSNGDTRKLEVYINGVWCTINFDGSGAVNAGGFGDRILDSDGNTGIFSEFATDENVLRFYSNGVYEMAMSTAGLQVASGFPFVMDGLGGDTKMVYNSTTSYLEFHLNGTKRMEMQLATEPLIIYSKPTPKLTSDLVLYLSFDGPNGSTTLTDFSPYNHITTANGNAVIDTSQSVSGGSSIKFDDAKPTYVSIASSTAFYLSNKNWEIDFWFRLAVSDTTTKALLTQWADGGSNAQFYIATFSIVSVLFAYSIDGASQVIKSFNVSSLHPGADNWAHWGFQRLDTDLIFLAGATLSEISRQSIGTDSFFNSTRKINIGSYADAGGGADQAFDGWVDEVVINNNVSYGSHQVTVYSRTDGNPVNFYG